MRVRIFGALRQLVGPKEVEVEVEAGDTVRDVLRALMAQYPALSSRVLDDDGNLQSSINILVNGRSIRFLEGVNTSLDEDDVLAIFPPVAGG